jgi:hypothetical protein
MSSRVHIARVVTISITHEAFTAIEATSPKGSRAEAHPDGKGGLLVTLLVRHRRPVGSRRTTRLADQLDGEWRELAKQLARTPAKTADGLIAKLARISQTR